MISEYENILSDDIKDVIYNRILTKEHLLTLNLSDILRVSSDNRYISKVMSREMDIPKGAPLIASITLKKHQDIAYMWIKERERSCSYNIRGGILSLNMGLGKTLVSAIYSLSHPSPKGYPTLVVCSKTVMMVWIDQLRYFFGDSIKVLGFHREYLHNIDEFISDRFVGYDIVLTTYDIVIQTCNADTDPDYSEYLSEEEESVKNEIKERVRIKTPLSIHRGYRSITDMPWHRIIADESQRFANYKTKLYSAMMGLSKEYGICLSGTPIRNYDTDLWSQLRWLGYIDIKNPKDWKGSGIKIFKNNRLDETVLYMSYEDVGIKMPEKRYIIDHVEIDGKEKIIYQYMFDKIKRVFMEHMYGNADFAQVLLQLTYVREACISPLLIRDAVSEDLIQYVDEIGLRSKKVNRVLEIVGKNKDKKIIIFSSFVRALEIVQRAIETEYSYIKCIQVVGKCTGKKRSAYLDLFRKSGDPCILFMTYKVGSEGLNLTESTCCICLEPWWAPSVKEQACARIWRIGQEKECIMYDIRIKDSIEDRIIQVAEEKSKMCDAFKGDNIKRVKSTGLNAHNIGVILGIYKR